MLKRYTAYFATFTLLLQLLLPLAPKPSVAAFTSLGEKVLICTAQGFQWVKWADLQSGKEQPQPVHPQNQCPACALQGQAVAVLPKAVTLDASAPLAALRWLPSYTHAALSGDILWQRDRSRAPPVVIA